MSWMIEGLATYEETELTAFGRGRNPDSRMVLRMAALERRFPKEDQAIYALDVWPDGQTPYLFGEAFLRWLSTQAGPDTLPRLARQHAVQFPPWLDGRTLDKVTGEGLHAQWRSWADAATAEFGAEALDARGPGAHRGARADQARDPSGLAALQPRRPDASRTPARRSRAIPRSGWSTSTARRPPPRAPQRRLRAVVDARRPGARLRRAAGAQDLPPSTAT